MTVKRVYVETNDTAKHREHEWIPLPCRKKVAVKELDTASRHSACDAWQTGEVVKCAARPREPERQPDSCKAER